MAPSSPTPTTFGCIHTKGLLQNAQDKAIDGYQKALKAITHDSRVGGKLYKTSVGGIATSPQVTYLCLQCPAVSPTRDKHRKEHQFVVESSRGMIFCHECRDFVYDPTLENVRLQYVDENPRKRKHAEFLESDKKLVGANSTLTSCAATGLRGLYNMGQTCFMSVILQSLIHNPFVRSWYLSEGHRSNDCDREACTSCALDDIFTDFYGQEKHEGYGAVHMLQGCWKGGGGLAGYSQQDAHEYLSFILNSLHNANTEEEDEMSSKRDAKNCDCMIHQTFGGLLKSTVTCTNCKNITSTTDPFMDLSLDIKSTTVSIKKKKLSMINGTQTIKEIAPMELTECLDRFTADETLSSDSYHCRKCDSGQEAKKRLSLLRLPPVIPIHLKRFAHSKAAGSSNKVGTKIRVPFSLDLAPYCSTPKKKKSDQQVNGSAESKKEEDKKGDANGKSSSDDGDKTPTTDPVYELSSVIVHKGKIDNGHYISYSRQADEWFRFDDSMVVQVDEKEVLNAEAYMLFYIIQEFV
ncbi:cysteine proteinase [Polychaeton citri CBS 116435]|uniref:Ubiquitin carboxyl-terminal hydrolase n=1 Tax=Polychaeton citri CBS 116435 TaxID=1314669 RepID=A0A9P4US62_9PEZI|nr:cysteine proteinase [Polychaeton citri CBS 116435]